MEFTIQDFKAETLNRGLITPDMQEAHTAIVKLANGDWIGVSRYRDEDYWVADCAFRANGFPVFSNGVGTRIVAVRTVSDEVANALNELRY